MENEEKKNQITMFQRESLGTMRTAIDEFSRPVFCLKDACDILDIKNPSDVKKRLKSTGVVRICQSDGKKFNNYLFVTESNLYRLIFQSRKESAESFMDWVTEDILPAIRRYGRYDVQTITKNDESAVAFLEDYGELQTKISILEKNQEETKEARAYVKRALDSYVLKDLYDVPEILGIRGIGIAEVLSILRNEGILDADNVPPQMFVDKGWFRVDSHTYQDKTAGTVSHKRVFCYRSGINQIRKLIDKFGGVKNGK
ncbi:MAG TPA: BRO family protein [Bacilli bacterium]|nr:BRO family protein [Bacilli bacterium]